MATTQTVHAQLIRYATNGDQVIVNLKSAGSDISIDRSTNTKLPTSVTTAQTLANALGNLAFKDSLSKGDVGLGSVDNTADANKSVKYATSAGSAGSATKDSANQQINTTYIKGLSASGRTITITKGDGTTSTITTQDTNTTYNVFAKATADANGGTGLVPAPAKGQQGLYLRGDGSWATPTNTVYTHPNSGVTAGTYRSVTVNAQGHVTAGTNPTTLAGNGITDAAKSGHTHTASQITDNIPASKISGVLSLSNIPAGALERLIPVVDDTARFKLTKNDAQNGDVVKVKSTGQMYFIKDETKLSTEDGYEVFAAGTAAAVAWTNVTGRPSSMPASDVSAWAKAASKPSYSKSEVGLSNVDNTADANKSVKYATSAGSVAWTNVSGRPTSMPASDVPAWAKAASKPSYSKSEVGLGNVDNTADSAKSVKYATTAGSANAVAWANVSGKPAITGKQTRTLTASGPSGWKDATTDQGFVPDMAFMAYWNGAYSGSSSNLAYCNRGAFGTIVTKNAGDYAPASHSHNYAGSGSAGGAANSANKLSAARTVSGGTDITLSFNYDGSGNSNANIGYYSSSANVGDSNNYPFHRFAKLDTITASYSDKSTTFFISQDYNGGGFGIVRIVLRTNNSSSVSSVEVKWLVRCGLSADSVQVGIYNVFDKTYADAFFKTGGSYAGTYFRAIASGSRGNASRTWVMINSSEASGTTASDAKTSKECYATIAAAGTALHKQAYTGTVSGTDGGTTSYANSAGSTSVVRDSNDGGNTTFAYSKAGLAYADYSWLAAWNGKELRAVSKSQFATASHTHNYAGSGSAGGSANSAVKLDSSAGNATTPVYFSGGKPVACTYTLGKSVPADAKFTDTNTTYPITYKTLDANFATKFRTETKGNTTAGDYIATVRNDTSGVANSPQFGSGLAWGRGDTHGYLYYNYSNAEMYVGAGNADKLNWMKKVAFSDHSHSAASSTANGLMSSTDKAKLDFGDIVYVSKETPTKACIWVKLD